MTVELLTTPEVVEVMTETDRNALMHAEAVIARGLKTFFEVGSALAQVRDGRLYRETHETFEAYCEERWGVRRRQAYRLIQAAEVVAEIEGDVSNWTQAVEPPARESQARELGKAPEGERAEAWEAAQERADSPQPPARVVKEVVEERAQAAAAPSAIPRIDLTGHSTGELAERRLVAGKFATVCVDEPRLEGEHLILSGDRDHAAIVLSCRESHPGQPRYTIDVASTELDPSMYVGHALLELKRLDAMPSAAVEPDPVVIEIDKDAYSTPEWVLDLARKVSGALEVDPASNPLAQETVKASIFYTADDDGLDPSNAWGGVVWLNPPYSRGLIAPFIDRACDEWEADQLEELWVLTNASVSSEWWQRLAKTASLMMYPPCRINFLDSLGRPTSNNAYSQSLAFCGPPEQVEQARTTFEAAGWVVTRNARAAARELQAAELKARNADMSAKRIRSTLLGVAGGETAVDLARRVMGANVADPAARKRRYRELSKLAHPDHGGAEELQQIINALWEVAQ